MFQNCFRLPLDDRVGQAPAVYATALNLECRNICLIQDVSIEAQAYSKPLYESIKKLFDNDEDLIVNKYKFNKDDYVLGNIIHSQLRGADLLIFCGYGTNANLFLRSIDEEPSLNNLNIILTDGCKINDLYVGNLNVYISFPVNIEVEDLCLDSNMDGGFSEEFSSLSNSFELHGYDAMKILESVMKGLEKEDREVSRENVLSELHKKEFLEGLCTKYALKTGENTLGNYYIYHCLTDSIVLYKKYSYSDLQLINSNN